MITKQISRSLRNGDQQMSDTPRTDEQINGKPCTQFGLLAGMSLRDALVPSEFARQLEREVAAANEACRKASLDALHMRDDFLKELAAVERR
jgi:hypothetical protein